jgi:hypothetical protein
MKITIEKTDEIAEVNGVPARVWNGVTEGGIACSVLVTRLAVSQLADASEFERELSETPAPQDLDDRVWPTRMVL